MHAPNLSLTVAIAMILVGAGGAGYFSFSDLLFFASGGANQSAAACVIKGNISETTGARIYHVPGQKYYNRTIIEPERGERWFCSEAEARAAGWRRAKI